MLFYFIQNLPYRGILYKIPLPPLKKIKINKHLKNAANLSFGEKEMGMGVFNQSANLQSLSIPSKIQYMCKNILDVIINIYFFHESYIIQNFLGFLRHSNQILKVVFHFTQRLLF